jgi:hypothetical protein
MSVCAVPVCADPVAEDAPVPLCEHHLAVAGEWSARRFGVPDLLPAPCVVCGSREGVRWPSGWVCAVCEWRHGEVPDDELPPPRVDVVYYLRYRDRVKIGTSAQPRRRLAALHGDELLVLERGDRRLERRRHEQFADERFAGTEWFRSTPRLLAHIDALRGGADDPWDRHRRWVSEALAARG